MKANVFKLAMAHPGDVSALDDLIVGGSVDPADIAAVIGKTEGNGGVNDFTRGYFTQSLLALLASHLSEAPDKLAGRIPCVVSGGTEGVLSPHYLVFSRSKSDKSEPGAPALAIGTAFADFVPPEHLGGKEHMLSISDAVRRAMRDALIDDTADVAFVQVKCPCLTSAKIDAAIAAGAPVERLKPGASMARARAAGAFGVAHALGEIMDIDAAENAALKDFSRYCSRASISSGVEVERDEVVLLGNSVRWTGDLRIAHQPMQDALDIAAISQVFADLNIQVRPQVAKSERSRIRAILVKGEPDRRGRIGDRRHTMLDDTDIDAQRHIRGALGGLVAGVVGDTQIFVSGGAEHQGPDGGGMIAVIASRPAEP